MTTHGRRWLQVFKVGMRIIPVSLYFWRSLYVGYQSYQSAVNSGATANLGVFHHHRLHIVLPTYQLDFGVPGEAFPPADATPLLLALHYNAFIKDGDAPPNQTGAYYSFGSSFQLSILFGS